MFNSARGERGGRAGGRPVLIMNEFFETVDATGVASSCRYHHSYFAAQAVARDMTILICQARLLHDICLFSNRQPFVTLMLLSTQRPRARCCTCVLIRGCNSFCCHDRALPRLEGARCYSRSGRRGASFKPSFITRFAWRRLLLPTSSCWMRIWTRCDRSYVKSTSGDIVF